MGIMSSANGADTTRKRPRRGRKSTPAATARTSGDFWGSVAKLPAVEEVVITPDPSALLRSLGRAPFPGHEAVSEHHLRAVYNSSVKLAEVLATAGDLLVAAEDGEHQH